jgi:hypothetical protein
VGPRADLDDVEKRKFLTLLELELRSLGCLARSQSQYQLSYPGIMTHIQYRTKSKYCHVIVTGRGVRLGNWIL